MSGYSVLHPGVNNVGNYTISGIPFVTGTLSVNASSGAPLEITFPSVTQRIHILNADTSKTLRIGFSAAGVSGTNHFLVQSSQTGHSNKLDLRVRTTKIYLLGNTDAITSNIYVSAELTGITGYDLAAAYSGNLGVG